MLIVQCQSLRSERVRQAGVRSGLLRLSLVVTGAAGVRRCTDKTSATKA